MRRSLLFVRHLRRDSRGATAVEYGLIIAMVILAMFGALKATATSTISLWNLISTKVDAHS